MMSDGEKYKHTWPHSKFKQRRVSLDNDIAMQHSIKKIRFFGSVTEKPKSWNQCLATWL